MKEKFFKKILGGLLPPIIASTLVACGGNPEKELLNSGYELGIDENNITYAFSDKTSVRIVIASELRENQLLCSKGENDSFEEGCKLSSDFLFYMTGSKSDGTLNNDVSFAVLYKGEDSFMHIAINPDYIIRYPENESNPNRIDVTVYDGKTGEEAIPSQDIRVIMAFPQEYNKKDIDDFLEGIFPSENEIAKGYNSHYNSPGKRFKGIQRL